MKQFLLAMALIALPVAAFTSYQVYMGRTTVATEASAASLGDLSAFSAIVTDVQSIAAKGDLTAAKARMKDFEIMWDENETGLKPMDPARWGQIDEAADAALSALRTGTPDPATVSETLVALQAGLQDTASVTK
jgi:hypothetical protein